VWLADHGNRQIVLETMRRSFVFFNPRTHETFRVITAEPTRQDYYHYQYIKRHPSESHTLKDSDSVFLTRQYSWSQISFRSHDGDRYTII
jgi:hypothetical protein